MTSARTWDWGHELGAIGEDIGAYGLHGGHAWPLAFRCSVHLHALRRGRRLDCKLSGGSQSVSTL